AIARSRRDGIIQLAPEINSKRLTIRAGCRKPILMMSSALRGGGNGLRQHRRVRTLEPSEPLGPQRLQRSRGPGRDRQHESVNGSEGGTGLIRSGLDTDVRVGTTEA